MARLVLGHRRAVLVLSAAVLAGFVALALGAFSVLKSGGFDDPGSSEPGDGPAGRGFGGATNLVLLVTPTGAGASVDSPAVARGGAILTAQLRERSDVTRVTSYWSGRDPALRSRGGQAGLITMHVVGSDDTVLGTADSVISDVTGARGAVLVRARGTLGFDHDSTAQVGRDLVLAESIAVPVTLILLLLAFGSVVAALLPLAIGLVAVAGTFAELDVLGHLTDVSVYAVTSPPPSVWGWASTIHRSSSTASARSWGRVAASTSRSPGPCRRRGGRWCSPRRRSPWRWPRCSSSRCTSSARSPTRASASS